MCGEVGLISRPHLLFGEVRSVTAALKVAEQVQQGLQFGILKSDIVRITVFSSAIVIDVIVHCHTAGAL